MKRQVLVFLACMLGFVALATAPASPATVAQFRGYHVSVPTCTLVVRTQEAGRPLPFFVFVKINTQRWRVFNPQVPSIKFHPTTRAPFVVSWKVPGGRWVRLRLSGRRPNSGWVPRWNHRCTEQGSK